MQVRGLICASSRSTNRPRSTPGPIRPADEGFNVPFWGFRSKEARPSKCSARTGSEDADVSAASTLAILPPLRSGQSSGPLAEAPLMAEDPVRENRTEATETLAAAIACAVAGPLAEAARQAVDSQLKEATQQIVEAVHKAENSALKVAIEKIGADLARTLKEAIAVSREAPQSVPHWALRVHPPCSGVPSSQSSAGHSRSNSRSNTGVAKRKGSRHLTGTSIGGNSIADKDVKSLEADLADMLLQDVGLSGAGASSGARAWRKKSRASSLSYSNAGDVKNSTLCMEDQCSLPVPAFRQAIIPHSLTPPDITRQLAPSRTPDELARQSHMIVDARNLPHSVSQETLGEQGLAELQSVTSEVLSVEEASMGVIGSLIVEGSSEQKLLKKCLTTDQILHVRVEELVEDIHPKLLGKRRFLGSELESISDNSEEEPWSPLVVFKVSGILPWGRPGCCTLCYHWAVFAVGVLALIKILVDAVLAHREGLCSLRPTCDMPGHACWQQRGLLSEVPLAASAVIGLALLGTLRGGEALSDTVVVLQAYAQQQGLQEQWHSRLLRDGGCILLLWFLVVAASSVGAWRDAAWSPPSVQAHLHILAVTASRSVLMSVAFCLVYVSRALTVMVDLFCCRVVDCPDIAEVVHDWNVLQAVLRKASITIERCFVALQVGAALSVLTLVLDLLALDSRWDALPTLVPGLLTIFGILQHFFQAALVTDKCVRIPSLINSLSFGPGTDRVKQHTVEYIMNSAAGFYVCDVRLTTATALKVMYMWSVIAFTMGTKVLAIN